MKKSTLIVLCLVGVGIVAVIALNRKQLIDYTSEEIATVASTISDAFTGLIARFEGFRGTPYQDSAGLWTIGYGHLIKDGDGFWSPTNPDGKTSLTQEEGKALLAIDSKTAHDCVDNNVSVELTDNQRAALISFVYNLGCATFKSSRLLQYVNNGDINNAAAQFDLYVNARDPNTKHLVKVAGLVTRRADEKQLFLT